MLPLLVTTLLCSACAVLIVWISIVLTCLMIFKHSCAEWKHLSHYLLISNFAYISVQYFDNMLTQVYFYTIYLLYSSQIWLIFKGKYQNSYFAAMCKHALVIFQSCNLPRCKISICLYWTRAQGDAVILVTASVRTLARLVQWPEELLVVGWGK